MLIPKKWLILLCATFLLVVLAYNPQIAFAKELPQKNAPIITPTNEQTPNPTAEAKTPLRTPMIGKCECPYDQDVKNHICGKRSAYNRPNGEKPKCYKSD